MRTTPLSASFGILVTLPALFFGGRLEAQKDPKPKADASFLANRKADARAAALRDYGGDDATEKAVAEGLKWLARQQLADGSWQVDAKGANAITVGGTALALLPFLGNNKTHKAVKGNPHDKTVAKGLAFLKRRQDAKTGNFGGTMYEHGLATLAMCEAYALTQDATLKPSAQAAINLILNSQHATTGGWSYAADNRAPHRDMSISAVQISALKTAQAAGLVVPKAALDRVKTFLDKVQNEDDGYGYLPGGSSTPRMTAAGLLSRQYLEQWGPDNPKFAKAFKKYIVENPPDRADSYYCYYATQVMFHAGGDDWKAWNETMRDYLLKKQDTSKANGGSWSPEGDPWGQQGGRLMVTSFRLLSLEVYYRHAPIGKSAAKTKE